jgi:BirA family biotin operon repressor/biotin-[acetyl-CoA-carboxylase] ligase
MGRVKYLKNNLLVEEIHFFNKVVSTMDVAKKFSLKFSKDRILVVSKQQTLGRGRLGRKWFSPLGGLYMTFVSKIPLEEVCFINYVFTLSLVQTLKKYRINAKPKWPNDVLVNGKKISGVLIENFCENNKIKFNFVGVGINLNISKKMFEKVGLKDAVSVKMLLGKNVSIKKFLVLFLKILSQNYSMLVKKQYKKILHKWKQVSSFIGKEVKIILNDKKIIHGKVVDINNDGSLKLNTGERVETIFYGDCLLSRFTN